MSLFAWISAWLPVSLWAGLIYYLSSIPRLNSGLGIWDLILRKIAHVVEFAMLTHLLLRAMTRTWPEAAKKPLMMGSGLAALLYAISDEIHQSFVPGRGPSVRDVVVDAVGIMIVLVVYRRKFFCQC